MAEQIRIMVVDDDPVISRIVSANLRQHGFGAITVGDGPSALKAMTEQNPDMVILDVMMPGMNGDEVCRRIREFSEVPIIMLSAKCDAGTRVDLLGCGADDYITKPFGIGELMARVRSLIRRKLTFGGKEAEPLMSGDLRVDLQTKRVLVGDREIELSLAEYRVLKELVMSVGTVIPGQTLLSRAWGSERIEDLPRLEACVDSLRNKIEADPENPCHILAETDSGYSLIAPAAEGCPIR